MTRERIYLDYNATAPLLPEVLEAMSAALALTGNPSSVHTEGRAARGRVEDARVKVAALVGGRAENVIFTASGSEANAMALTPLVRVSGACSIGGCATGEARAVTRLLIGATEHPSVLAGGGFAADRIERLPVDDNGIVRLDWLRERLTALAAAEPDGCALVSVQMANSETGVLQPVAEIAAAVHVAGGVMHTDAIQAAGRMPLDIGALGVDMLTLSAHKLGGPQGVGALVLGAGGVELGHPLVRGGGQERGRRAGTENVAGIAGFGLAAALAMSRINAYPARLKAARDRFERDLKATIPQAEIFGSNVERLSNTSAFAVPGLKAETLLMALDLAGFAVSSGSACSSGKVKRSHVLEAMGVPPEVAEGALRVSIGHASGDADLDSFRTALEKVVGMLISRQKGRSAA
ncbi:cysteine desulfurase family protein [Pseudochelatococcus contaminans]|uniref:Cysteine desulfurase n=1 Tax=Pseudochelatococcus contaminans TaxID=1538103 RepID=A0A7W6EIA5_9HYPH|nr:cysteine desulfurase family protein [Pseudochelatococcus contaminans]MBB3810858.1 cysteine desulfurase [Pseudochelatococcus contaminans]